MSFFEKVKIDPIAFEILRHRLFAINDEAAATLRAVSGSPVANEAYDFNTGITNAKGEVVATGIYVGVHAITLEAIIKGILDNYAENPGIRPGDMFICNDPYWGAAHQNDVALVAPIFWEGELIAWTGVAVHQVDVGGIVRGSQCCIGADSIYQEGVPMPPVKIVENNAIRRDIKEQYLRRCRFPQLVELDLRAKIAANNTTIARVQELVQEYGIAETKKAIEAIIDYVEFRLRERLKELPDGVWRHTSYLEYEGKCYRCNLTMQKVNDRLIFDFSGSSGQARAVANCCVAATRGAILTVLLQYLAYDMPWSAGGVMRVTEVKTPPGSIVDATWPAGVSKGTTAAAQAVLVLTSICASKMMASSDALRDRAMAGWMGGIWSQEVSGRDEKGIPFNCVLLESMVGGGGALPYKDGIDTAGMLHAVGCCKANVETTESRYPILYVYSRQEKDSGGAGRFRGGTGYGAMYMLHGVNEAMNLVLGFTPENTEAPGLAGGYPGGSAIFAVKQGSNIYQLFEQGIMPGDLSEVSGELAVLPSAYLGKLARGDVWARQNTGGGGFGDPVLRDPNLVLQDVLNHLVSREAAEETCGVILTRDKKPRIDVEGTLTRRQQIMEMRKLLFSRSQMGVSEGLVASAAAAQVQGGDGGRRVLNEYLVLKEEDGRKLAACHQCDHVLGEVRPGGQLSVLSHQGPLSDAGRQVDPYHKEGKFLFHQTACPNCLTLLESEIVVKQETDIVADA
ncbi:MAG: hydantoinase B/oxoprolinase family protein [Chloroflexi bacterium]|nr:hydantoinase B/oxoprolinase family protein [Chloroflexota bacterium]